MKINNNNLCSRTVQIIIAKESFINKQFFGNVIIEAELINKFWNPHNRSLLYNSIILSINKIFPKTNSLIYSNLSVYEAQRMRNKSLQKKYITTSISFLDKAKAPFQSFGLIRFNFYSQVSYKYHLARRANNVL